MTILKFKKRIKVDKSIGNLKIQTQLRDSYENGKSKEWTECVIIPAPFEPPVRSLRATLPAHQSHTFR